MSMLEKIKGMFGFYDGSNAAISGKAGNRRNTQRHKKPSHESDYVNIFELEERILKTTYLMAQDTLVKVSIEAERRYEWRASYDLLCYKCRVLEIDGHSQQERNGASYERLNGVVLAPEEQLKLILDALALYGITGYPVRVSDDYAQGRLRVIELQQRIRKGGA